MHVYDIAYTTVLNGLQHPKMQTPTFSTVQTVGGGTTLEGGLRSVIAAKLLLADVSVTVAVGGAVERRVADPAVISTRQVPRLRRPVAVDRHSLILSAALCPHIRRQINVLAAHHCNQSINQSVIQLFIHSFIHSFIQ